MRSEIEEMSQYFYNAKKRYPVSTIAYVERLEALARVCATIDDTKSEYKDGTEYLVPGQVIRRMADLLREVGRA